MNAASDASRELVDDEGGSSLDLMQQSRRRVDSRSKHRRTAHDAGVHK